MPVRWRTGSAHAALLAAIVVAACGGGGEDETGATAGSAPALAPTGAAAATCGLADFKATMLARVNRLRAAGANCGSAGSFAATGAVAWNDRLAAAASGHSADMAATNIFDHTGSDGRMFADRIAAAGYAWSSAGENIAAGYATVDAAMDGWIASPGHCANLMSASFTEIGAACAPGTPADRYSNYWTMDLARPR